jgi:hypothetical protein
LGLNISLAGKRLDIEVPLVFNSPWLMDFSINSFVASGSKLSSIIKDSSSLLIFYLLVSIIPILPPTKPHQIKLFIPKIHSASVPKISEPNAQAKQTNTNYLTVTHY